MTDRIRVLYVDDDARSLEMRASILREEFGFDVTTATDVDTGLSYLSESSFDCVLSDYKMPDRDGFDFLAAVRERDPTLPFILFTAVESADVASRAFEAGATDYVPKSVINISYELLGERIKQAVAQHTFKHRLEDDYASTDAVSDAVTGSIEEELASDSESTTATELEAAIETSRDEADDALALELEELFAPPEAEREDTTDSSDVLPILHQSERSDSLVDVLREAFLDDPQPLSPTVDAEDGSIDPLPVITDKPAVGVPMETEVADPVDGEPFLELLETFLTPDSLEQVPPTEGINAVDSTEVASTIEAILLADPEPGAGNDETDVTLDRVDVTPTTVDSSASEASAAVDSNPSDTDSIAGEIESLLTTNDPTGRRDSQPSDGDGGWETVFAALNSETLAGTESVDGAVSTDQDDSPGSSSAESETPAGDSVLVDVLHSAVEERTARTDEDDLDVESRTDVVQPGTRTGSTDRPESLSTGVDQPTTRSEEPEGLADTNTSVGRPDIRTGTNDRSESSETGHGQPDTATVERDAAVHSHTDVGHSDFRTDSTDRPESSPTDHDQPDTGTVTHEAAVSTHTETGTSDTATEGDDREADPGIQAVDRDARTAADDVNIDSETDADYPDRDVASEDPETESSSGDQSVTVDLSAETDTESVDDAQAEPAPEPSVSPQPDTDDAPGVRSDIDEQPSHSTAAESAHASASVEVTTGEAPHATVDDSDGSHATEVEEPTTDEPIPESEEQPATTEDVSTKTEELAETDEHSDEAENEEQAGAEHTDTEPPTPDAAEASDQQVASTETEAAESTEEDTSSSFADFTREQLVELVDRLASSSDDQEADEPESPREDDEEDEVVDQPREEIDDQIEAVEPPQKESVESHEGSSDEPIDLDGAIEQSSGSPGASTSRAEWEETDGYDRPSELELRPGDSVLVQCNSQDDRGHAACQDLRTPATRDHANVLQIRYQELDREELESIAVGSTNTTIIAVGYQQPIPDAWIDEIEVIHINNPNDLTRLGIVITGILDGWQGEGTPIAVCFDQVEVVLQYKPVQNVFRFLHVLLGKLRESNAVSHFHIDPTAGDPQETNVLKPLFDEALTIDSLGVNLE